MLKRGRGNKTPKPTERKILKMLTETDLSPQKIADEVGVSRWLVRRIFESAKSPPNQEPG